LESLKFNNTSWPSLIQDVTPSLLNLEEFLITLEIKTESVDDEESTKIPVVWGVFRLLFKVISRLAN
jgi:hypothetical protein